MVQISQGKTYQTVITTYEVTPGTFLDLVDELKGAFDSYIQHQTGFVNAAIHVNDAQTRIANYSQWETREDFQAVLRSAEMRVFNRKFSELCKSFEPVLYEVTADY